MDTAKPDAIAALLTHCAVVGIEISDAGNVRRIHNTDLLKTWTTGNLLALEPGLLIANLLEQLFSPQHTQLLEQKFTRLRDAGGATHDLGVLPGRLTRATTMVRYLSVSLQLLSDAPAGTRLLVLQDVSAQQTQRHALDDAQTAYDTALAVLRAPPDALRLFLGAALASIGAIRATLRMPARTHASLRNKLTRLRAECESLGSEALALELGPVTHACLTLVELIATLQQRDSASGDDLLPLAPRVDSIAIAIGNAARIEEQRPTLPSAAPVAAPVAAEVARRVRKIPVWHEVSERRWSEFLRGRGEEIGTLARFKMTGAEQVPAALRRHIDEMLQHLLRNAVEHGLETPEQRLKAGKSATGQIAVGFEESTNGDLKITVHDDGRGFDLARIGQAAVQCGLLSEESLATRGAGDLMGFIFKPAFTTEALPDNEGRGRGMTFLRKTVTRLGGQISVATKPGRYTLFTIKLPASLSIPQGKEADFA
jgi:signal transduction histidine kinase